MLILKKRKKNYLEISFISQKSINKYSIYLFTVLEGFICKKWSMIQILTFLYNVIQIQ